MGRAFLTMIFSVPLSIVAFFIGLFARNWKIGLICALVVISIGLIVALLFILFQRNITLSDVFLPIPLAILWSIILLPFSLGTNVFSAPASIGSAIILSLFLYWYRDRKIKKATIIIPAIVFIYEMLPINIPGPFDDYFAFGGTATIAIFTMIGLLWSPKNLISHKMKNDEE